MTPSDGTVVGTTLIVDNGPPQCRFNLVLVAEGYTQAQLGQFATDAQDFVDTLFTTPPFDGLKPAFNVYRIDVSSTDSGADDPVACGGTGATPATYFDASFCNGGIQRLLIANTPTVLSVVNTQVAQWHQILVIVNSPIYGGSGGTVAATANTGVWKTVAMHELGHSAFGLADEYEYWAGCGIDVGQDVHPPFEPIAANVSIDSNPATNKWRDLVLPATPWPTTSNSDCTQCDSQPNPLPAGTVGTFEGADYYHCGAFRPEFDCMMRNLVGFCAVCRRRIDDTLRPFLPPRCAAPIFPPVSFAACIFLYLFYGVLLIGLTLWAGLMALLCLFFGSGSAACRSRDRLRCRIKQVQFRLKNCGTGNSDPCLALD